MRPTLPFLPLWSALLVSLLALVACGGGGGAKGPDVAPKAPDLDADPLVLLPGSALAVGRVETQAFATSYGEDMARLVEKVVPIGEEAGFVASRDVERVYIATYATQGADVAAALTGHFDADRVAKAAESRTVTKGGAPLTVSTYAGRPVYAVGLLRFVILTPKTAVAGTEDAVRRVLERVQDGRVDKRSFPDWMLQTVDTKAAQFAFAADFASASVASAALESLPVPWLKGLRMARVVGTFEKPGLHVAGTLTYAEEGQARDAANGIRTADAWLKVASPFLRGVPEIENLDVKIEQSNVACSFAVDDQELKSLLAAAPAWIPSPGATP